MCNSIAISLVSLGLSVLSMYLNQENFEQSNLPKLKINAYMISKEYTKPNGIHFDSKTVDPIIYALPINIGKGDGIYRFFGICQEKDIDTVVELLKKAHDNTISSDEKHMLTEIISYQKNNPNGKEQTGNELLYPAKKEAFETIEANHIGTPVEYPNMNIQIDLKVEKPVYYVIFVDPDLNCYYQKVKKSK